MNILEIIKKENELVSEGSTKIIGKYENLDELKSYLDDLSYDIEKEVKNSKSIYDNKRIDYLKNL
ncbi:MAG: hypothetical protein ACOCRX_01130 [Candidatus Woesearchaeota archaeon]